MRNFSREEKYALPIQLAEERIALPSGFGGADADRLPPELHLNGLAQFGREAQEKSLYSPGEASLCEKATAFDELIEPRGLKTLLLSEDDSVRRIIDEKLDPLCEEFVACTTILANKARPEVERSLLEDHSSETLKIISDLGHLSTYLRSLHSTLKPEERMKELFARVTADEGWQEWLEQIESLVTRAVRDSPNLEMRYILHFPEAATELGLQHQETRDN